MYVVSVICFSTAYTSPPVLVQSISTRYHTGGRKAACFTVRRSQHLKLPAVKLIFVSDMMPSSSSSSSSSSSKFRLQTVLGKPQRIPLVFDGFGHHLSVSFQLVRRKLQRVAPRSDGFHHHFFVPSHCHRSQGQRFATAVATERGHHDFLVSSVKKEHGHVSQTTSQTQQNKCRYNDDQVTFFRTLKLRRQT